MARYTPNRTDIRLIVDPTNRPTKVRKCRTAGGVAGCSYAMLHRNIGESIVANRAETWPTKYPTDAPMVGRIACPTVNSTGRRITVVVALQTSWRLICVIQHDY